MEKYKHTIPLSITNLFPKFLLTSLPTLFLLGCATSLEEGSYGYEPSHYSDQYAPVIRKNFKYENHSQAQLEYYEDLERKRLQARLEAERLESEERLRQKQLQAQEQDTNDNSTQSDSAESNESGFSLSLLDLIGPGKFFKPIKLLRRASRAARR